MISVEGLVFDYPGTRALDAVSLAIAPQTITALVGPNGAGKTTLLRCMAALETPAAGAVRLDGIVVHEEPREIHRRLGYLSDFYGLYDELTVRQCLLHRASMQGVPSADQDALTRRAAERLDLADRLEQKAGALSRGLRQRLAIAQAIIHEPKVVLLDEPAAGLDPEARESLARVLTNLRTQGMTLVVSSHILAELQDYSTHMLIISGGKVVENAPIEGAAGSGRVLLSVRLAAPDARLVQMLGAIGEVQSVEPQPDGARFSFPDSASAQAELLRTLVGAGLPVASFAVERVDLQQAYLQHVRSGRAA